MTWGTNITRRGFLVGLVYLTSWEFLQLSGKWNTLHAARKTDALAVKLADFQADKRSAKVVGLTYLRSVPSEAKVDLLVDYICSFNEGKRAELVKANKAKLKELLRRRQRDDFEHERVVNVRGWILSETECRLCALTALI
jgi:hypothetical protein